MRRSRQADLDQPRAVGEVRSELLGESVIGGAILAAARTVDDLAALFVLFGLDRIGIFRALEDVFGALVDLLFMRADQARGEGRIGAATARAEQDEPARRRLARRVVDP